MSFGVPKAINPPQACKLQSFADVIAWVWLGAVGFLCPDIEKRCLLCSMLAQYIHLVDVACNNISLFALIPALCLVLLSLLPRLFLLTLGERRSASWHMYPLVSSLIPQRQAPAAWDYFVRTKATSAAHAADVDGRDSRRAHGRRHHCQNDGRHHRPGDGPPSVWPR